MFNKLWTANPETKFVIHLRDFYYSQVLNFDSDFEYRVLSLIHIQLLYKLNLIMEKPFIGAWGLAIMQRPKLKPHNFDRDLDTQNALTERHVADEINLNQNVLKQLEFFIQNRLGRHIS